MTPHPSTPFRRTFGRPRLARLRAVWACGLVFLGVLKVPGEVFYRTGAGELRSLSLRRVELSEPSNLEKISRYYDAPDAGPPPNLAFVVVDAAAGAPEAGHICGVLYQHFNRLVAPWPTWSTNIVWDAEHQEAYLGVTKVTRNEVDLTVCRVKATENLGPSASTDLFQDRRNLPRASPLLATVRKVLPEAQPCAVTELRMLVEPRHLFIHLGRELADCEPLRFRIGLQDSEVREVTFEERPVQSPLPPR